MKKTSDFEFNDLQGLLRFGYGGLTDTCFMLLDVVNVSMAREWLATAPISSGIKASSLPDTAMQIAFSKEGLSALEISKTIIDGFSDEFIYGMVRSDNCSRRLGDVGHNAPKLWKWGNNAVPHVLLLLYAKQGGIDAWRKTVEDELFKKAFRLIRLLPTTDTGGNRMEPFGFEDGISQPTIDWALRQSTDPHERDRYSNLLAAGEMVLGYKNEYGQYTERPLIDPAKDPLAEHLPNAEDDPTLKDFARNGTYLILRELGQDVPGFWQFLNKVSNSEPNKREKLAASMVGRERDGTPLIAEHIAGVSRKDHGNNFTYDLDANGVHCPISAHVRRANPRTGDLPSGAAGFISQLIRILGFGQRNHDVDLVA